MPLTANDLINSVASFMQRRPDNFIRNGTDSLLRACNNARLFAERQIDFELSRVSATVPAVDLNNGGSLDDAVLFGTITPVNVKKIKRPFIQFGNNSNAVPVGFYSRDSWLKRLKRLWESVLPANTSSVTVQSLQQFWTRDFVATLQPYSVIQMGRTVYVAPADLQGLGQTFPLHMDVLKMLPNYGSTGLTGNAFDAIDNKLHDTSASFITAGVRIGMVVSNTTQGTYAIVAAIEDQTTLVLNGNIFDAGEGYSINVTNENDFLLDNCFDWLMYRAIWELNFFLKEDERVSLDRDLINESWEAVKSWNENLINLATDNSDLS
jgi:hypothetical protein